MDESKHNDLGTKVDSRASFVYGTILCYGTRGLLETRLEFLEMISLRKVHRFLLDDTKNCATDEFSSFVDQPYGRRSLYNISTAKLHI